jgi:hypothetical protein
MPILNFLPPILAILLCAAFLAVPLRRAASRKKRSAFDDRLLWVGLAAGLFDSEDCPATSRLEIALAAISRKLGLRAAIVTVHSRDACRVLATAGSDASLLRGLNCDSVHARDSLYCGTLAVRGQSLAIDYAGLTEWRRHRAYAERGWESYIAVHCGLEQGEDLVVAFFDTVPRDVFFTRAERALVEQLGPWIATMIGDDGAKAKPDSPSHAVADAPSIAH